MLNVVRHHLKKREEWPGHPPRDEGALLTVKIPTTKWLISSLKKKIGLTNAKLRHQVLAFLKDIYPPKKFNSDAVKFRMQRKTDSKLIAHHKAINKNRKEVK
jgi:hypothetical protein